MDVSTTNYYEQNAQSIAARYEGVASPVEPLFAVAFPERCRVLDVGCGSGRDTARLFAKGCDAYGIEPTSGLRASAVAAHPELTGRIEAGSLPDIGAPFGGRFDGVLCSAVLMHVPDSQLFDSALAIRKLLKLHGRLLLSLPMTRGESLVDDRDANGRLFQSYSPEEITLLFERIGFQLIGRWDTEDSLARTGTSWYTLLLELRNTGTQRPVDQIETILNRDRKEATYKLALFRALAEMATQEPRFAVWLANGEVGVPIKRIAELWLQYYWPIFAFNRLVPQSQAEGAEGKPIKFRACLNDLISRFATQGEHGGLTSWQLASTSNRLDTQTQALLNTVLKTIAQTIRDGPVTYSGGALDTGPVFKFDSKTRLVLMPSDLWRELSLLGHWISDAVILRWAALTQKFSHRQCITAGDVLPLLLARPEPLRATALVRQIYGAVGVNRCTWSDKALRHDFAVDHVIPFSLWGNNDLWNLVPTDPKTNNAKSDKLPTSELLEDRQAVIVESWEILRSEMPESFDLQAQHLLGKSLPVMGSWQVELLARLREAVEMTAMQRGVERWAPIRPLRM